MSTRNVRKDLNDEVVTDDNCIYLITEVATELAPEILSELTESESETMEDIRSKRSVPMIGVGAMDSVVAEQTFVELSSCG